MDAFILKNSHLMNTMHAMFKMLIGALFENANFKPYLGRLKEFHFRWLNPSLLRPE